MLSRSVIGATIVISLAGCTTPSVVRNQIPQAPAEESPASQTKKVDPDQTVAVPHSEEQESWPEALDVDKPSTEQLGAFVDAIVRKTHKASQADQTSIRQVFGAIDVADADLLVEISKEILTDHSDDVGDFRSTAPPEAPLHSRIPIREKLLRFFWGGTAGMAAILLRHHNCEERGKYLLDLLAGLDNRQRFVAYASLFWIMSHPGATYQCKQGTVMTL